MKKSLLSFCIIISLFNCNMSESLVVNAYDDSDCYSSLGTYELYSYQVTDARTQEKKTAYNKGIYIAPQKMVNILYYSCFMVLGGIKS